MKDLSHAERALVLDPKPVPENYNGLVVCTTKPPCGHCYYCLKRAVPQQTVTKVNRKRGEVTVNLTVCAYDCLDSRAGLSCPHPTQSAKNPSNVPSVRKRTKPNRR